MVKQFLDEAPEHLVARHLGRSIDDRPLARILANAFGWVTSETNPPVDSLFLFTARPFDQDTQLQNNLNRWYDARVGGWLSEDPIGYEAGDANLYRYVRG